MVSVRRLEAIAADRVKSRFVFTIDDNPGGQNTKVSGTMIAMLVAKRLADSLAKEGYNVSEPAPAKACDSCFVILFEDFRVEVVILTKQQAASTECGLLTWCEKGFWNRLPLQLGLDSWEKVCSAIERVLRTDPSVRSLSAFTRNEHEARL